MAIRRICLLLLPLFATLACNDEDAPDCLKSSGKVVKQQRMIGRFSQVFLYDDADLYLKMGTESVITVEAGENLLPKIQTTHSGDSLVIRNSNRCNWVRSYRKPLRVTVSIPSGTDLFIIHNGYGEVKSLDSLRLNYLSAVSFDGGGPIDLHGNFNYAVVFSNSPAPISLSGKAEEATIWLNRAIGRLSAEKLVAQKCIVRHSGSNEIRVFPVQELQAEITEHGTVAYYHEPAKIVSTITGKGKLEKRQ